MANTLTKGETMDIKTITNQELWVENDRRVKNSIEKPSDDQLFELVIEVEAELIARGLIK